MHDAGHPPGRSLAGAARRRRAMPRDEAVALLAQAGMPPPLPRPAGRPDPQADPFSPLLHAAAWPPGERPGAKQGPGCGPGTGIGAGTGSGTGGGTHRAPGIESGAGDASIADAVRPRTRPEAPPLTLRARLLARVAASAADARRMHTQRHADGHAVPWAAGVHARVLYRAEAGRCRRPGEPEQVALVELARGAVWLRDASPLQQECLVLRGQARLGDRVLRALDHRVQPAGHAGAERWSSDGGALLLLRECLPCAVPDPVTGCAAGSVAGPVAGTMNGAPCHAKAGATPADTVQRARTARWDDHAPGIRRRILWRQGAQAAMLYHALPGAAVPRHGHGHDEECLLLAGDFLLDEVLLRPLDYQIAPAGTGHRVSRTDTGVVLYAHGDVDLDVR